MTSRLFILFLSLQVWIVKSGPILDNTTPIENGQIDTSPRPIRVSNFKVKDAVGPEFNILIYRNNN